MHHLKKYPNRRLYDTTDSQYVTIEDVRKLIADPTVFISVLASDNINTVLARINASAAGVTASFKSWTEIIRWA